MKRAVLLCALALLLSLLFSFAIAEETEPETFTSGDYKYILLPDGTAEITKYSGKDEALSIPDTLNGKKVTSIGNAAFDFCETLTSVTIPDSVTSIGNYAFDFCDSLRRVTIPDSVTSVGANPFSKCEKLTAIRVSPDHPTLAVINGVLFYKPEKRLVCYPYAKTDLIYSIPQGIKSIGDAAFSGCTSLTDVTIPVSVTSIGDAAFSGCTSLKNVTIPASVTSIGDAAFSGCTSLTDVTIPASVTSIGANPFQSCKRLTTLHVSSYHPVLAVIGGVLFYKPEKRLVCFPSNKPESSYTIPQGIKSIGDYSFSDCYKLTNVTIPNGVTSIGNDAFSGCKSLTSMTIPDSVTSIGKNAIEDYSNLTLAVQRDSYAAQYCKENNLNYTYPDSLDWLNN